MYTAVVEHLVLLPDDKYLGNSTEPLGAAYNRQYGDTKRRGDRVIMYWDANFNWLGWSLMLDRVTGIGAVADGWAVSWRWRIAPPNHELGETHIGEIEYTLARPLAPGDL